MRQFKTILGPSALFGALSLAGAAWAADVETVPPVPAPAPERQWTITVAPYFWMAGLDGDVGLFGQEPVHLDESFSDIIQDLKFGGMIVTELHNGEIGIFNDLMYAKTEADESVTRSLLGVPTTLAATVKSTSFTGTLMGEYRIYSEPAGTLDLMAGARLWDIDNDINIALTFGSAPLAAFSGSDGATWVDPMVGAKGRYNINETWFVNGWAMVGGFGAGSDITWDLLAAVGYQYNEHISFGLGYRALGVDYDHDGFVYDVVQHGPILGTVFKF
jgi:hypothetical protein